MIPTLSRSIPIPLTTIAVLATASLVPFCRFRRDSRPNDDAANPPDDRTPFKLPPPDGSIP